MNAISDEAKSLLSELSITPQVVGYDHRIAELDRANLIVWVSGRGYFAREKARDLLRDIQLTEDQRLVLGVLGREFNTGPYYGNTYLTFAGIEARLETAIGKQRVRLACRALTRQGLACFRNGLWADEGPAGSGYAATPDGALVALAIEDSERSGAASTGESQGATE